MPYEIKTYYRKEDLPPLEDTRFFHYTLSFDWCRNISYYTPLMVVAFEDGKPIASMFAVIMRINRFLHGSFFKRCYISQQPSFHKEDISKIEVFDCLITHLVKETRNKVFFIEYRNLNDTIFGYKGFRENKFYSIKWINIRNSLQRRRKIWDQLSASRKNQINKAVKKGVITEEITSEKRLREIYNLIQSIRNWKMTNRFPPYGFFENFYHYYIKAEKGKILLTQYQDKIIGGIMLGFENKTVYCLYEWGKNKTYAHLHPSAFTIFSAMEMAEENGFEYFDFLDAGFLNKNAGKPRFLLQFGGKQKATRRWYRFNWRLLNFFANTIHD